jgi:FkbM family methyltransferase
MKKIIKNIFRPIKKIIFKLVYLQKGQAYVSAFNFYSFVFNLNGRIYRENEFFFIKDDIYKYRFYHRKQGLMAYSNGLKARGYQIGNDYLLHRVKFQKDDIVIDCGANNGDLYLYFSKNIRYIGIEPSPIEFSNLSYNIKNQKLINRALYKNNDELATFYLSSEYGDSSLIKIKNYTEEIKIKTLTLDNLIDEIDQNIKLIKLEAEGAEPEILEGLSKNIGKVEFISIDVGYERGELQESTLIPCLNFLMKRNFELIDFNPNRFVILLKNRGLIN